MAYHLTHLTHLITTLAHHPPWPTTIATSSPPWPTTTIATSSPPWPTTTATPTLTHTHTIGASSKPVGASPLGPCG